MNIMSWGVKHAPKETTILPSLLIKDAINFVDNAADLRERSSSLKKRLLSGI